MDANRLRLTTIRVISHDPSWAGSFTLEAARIRAAVGDTAVRIHHIGSTAVPHTKAKPIIDMLLEASSLDALDAKTPTLEALGYEAKGEYGIPGRRYFRMNDREGARTHQLHAFAAEGPEVARHLAFRDYLRAHPAAAEEYGSLKQRLAREHPHDMAAYMAGKDAFVKEHERRALAWACGAGVPAGSRPVR